MKKIKLLKNVRRKKKKKVRLWNSALFKKGQPRLIALYPLLLHTANQELLFKVQQKCSFFHGPLPPHPSLPSKEQLYTPLRPLDILFPRLAVCTVWTKLPKNKNNISFYLCIPSSLSSSRFWTNKVWLEWGYGLTDTPHLRWWKSCANRGESCIALWT